MMAAFAAMQQQETQIDRQFPVPLPSIPILLWASNIKLAPSPQLDYYALPIMCGCRRRLASLGE